MPWDKDTFINNINYLIDAYCGGKAKVFNTRIGMRDAATRWKKEEFKPAIDTIMNICDTFGCSIDWLLTGKIPTTSNVMEVREASEDYNMHGDFGCGWPNEIKKLCHQVKEIMESDHPTIPKALDSNIASFHYSLRKEAEQQESIKKLTQKIRHLEKQQEDGASTGIEAADDAGTNKKAM